tara:strand:+ start:1865 stop:2083 length:219 start_codon:yes stop_codon:yes gene_type:complete
MKLPQISGIELVKRLSKFGFEIVRQRGSHIRLEKMIDSEIIKITVPNHPLLKKGTLHRIVKDCGLIPEEIFD